LVFAGWLTGIAAGWTLAWIAYVNGVAGAGIGGKSDADLCLFVADSLGKPCAIGVALALGSLLVDEEAARGWNEEKSEQEPNPSDASQSRNVRWRLPKRH
jgi:hypothetical protein